MNKALIIIGIGISVAFNANAQKLPQVQNTGVRLPANIKMDGKITEWGDKLQAYNPATEVFYTMANDDKNLYLVLQSPDPNIIRRIVAQGVTLSFQNGVNKDEKNVLSITYPIRDRKKYFSFNLPRKGVKVDTSLKRRDSIMISNNKLAESNYKFIAVNRMSGKDTLAVYNNDGIAAIARFDNKSVFTCEFLIDLKHLSFLDSNSKFNYHIVIHGPVNVGIVAATDVNGVVDEKETARVRADLEKLTASTDLWGEYTLVKK